MKLNKWCGYYVKAEDGVGKPGLIGIDWDDEVGKWVLSGGGEGWCIQLRFLTEEEAQAWVEERKDEIIVFP